MIFSQRIHSLLGALQSGLYEREHIMAMALLASIAGESMFLLGPPGVAKSMIARRLKYAFRHGRAFEYLMSRFSTPDEIFGPVSISRLRDEDRYERLTKGYLPQSEVVFLDEVWKASPSIQNTLLTVLNERIFRNGDVDEKMPLQLLMAASNELPAQGEGLEALWDRFLIRCMVDSIHRDDLFDAMITDVSEDVVAIPEDVQLDISEVQSWRESIRQITLPPLVLYFIHALRQELLSPSQSDKSALPVYVSDRRWKKSVNLMRTSAFLMGQSEVHLADALLLSHVLWSTTEEFAVVRRMMTNALTKALSEFLGVELAQERLDALRTELKCGPSSFGQERKLRVVHAFYHQLKTRSGKTILIYINELNTLSATSDTPYILMTDKMKTQAQILKKYERSRHPGIFPKDILQVHRQGDSVVVNGVEYPLVYEEEDHPMPSPRQASLTEDHRAMMQRILVQNKELESQFNLWRETEDSYQHDHLFVDDKQRAMFSSALKNVTYSIKRLLTESEEVCSL